jgi:hypothetical protein
VVTFSGSYPSGSRWRRVWTYTWRIACLLAGIGIIVLAALSFDDRRMDTTALRYVPRTLSEQENGYLVLAKAADQLGKPDDLSGDSFSDALYGRSWDSAQVEGWLKDRDFALVAVHQVRSLPFGQVPVPDNVGSAYGPQPRVYLPIYLAVLRAQQLLHENDASTAATMVCDALHAARIVMGSRGDALTYVCAIGAQTVALEAAYAVISSPRATLDDCRKLLDEISRARPTAEDFTQLLAADFRMKLMLVDALNHPQDFSDGFKLNRTESLAYRLPFLYKPNQSINYVIPWYLYYGSVFDLSFEKRQSQWTAAESQLPDLCKLSDECLNSYGKRAAHNFLYPAFGGIINSRLRQQTDCSIGETLVALRLYYDATSGQLPASLEELVPAYLPSVPLDYADGLPIKYSREMKALWSVGENHFTLNKEDQEVEIKATIVPVRFDGTYAPWKRIDPNQSKEGGAGFFGQ